MIYNLTEYLNTQFPTFNFACNGSEISSPETVVEIIQNNGESSHYIERKDLSVQFIVRESDKVLALNKADLVYDYLENKFGVTFPSVTVDGTLYEAIKIWRIVPISTPGYIGSDENGRHMVSFNFTITIT